MNKMTEAISIERKPMPGEKFQRLGQKSQIQLFVDELHKHEQKYTQLHAPFDRVCAKIDFEDRYDAVRREIERTEGSISLIDTRLKIDFGDFDKYGDLNRFEKINVVEDWVNRTIDGRVQPILISMTELFRCKGRHHNIAVQVPLDEWKKREELSKK